MINKRTDSQNRKRTTQTSIAPTGRLFAKSNTPTPCIFVVFLKEGAASVDRFKISAPFCVGRSANCDFVVTDKRLSNRHFSISEDIDGYWIKDLGSTNGTYLNGIIVKNPTILKSTSVIRAGEGIYVFHADGQLALEPFPADRLDIVGDFHGPVLAKEVAAACFSALHLLVEGPSGAGKELVAKGIAKLMSKSGDTVPFVVHNAARFSSEEEAITTIFGVANKVFSDVAARPGLIELARGGVLFLDEVHNLPERVQRALLRTVEDGKYSRIGEMRERTANVRFVLASNAKGPRFGLAHDLVARLRVIHVPPLCQRTADIPSIFDALMKRTLEKFNLPPDILKPYLATDYYEALCLDGFFDNNARGIISIADHIASTIALGVAPAEAVAKVFVKRFSDGLVVRRRADDNKYKAEKVTMHSPNKRDPETVSASLSTSHYELHKSYIISVFKKSRGNVAETHRRLHDTGIKCSRRWLDIFLDKWGVERRRYASRKRKSHIGES